MCMKNLRYHFPTCYAYSVKEPIGELNLKRALDEDTGVFSSFFHLLHWVRQPFLGIPPFISDPGILCLLLYLDLHVVPLVYFNQLCNTYLLNILSDCKLLIAYHISSNSKMCGQRYCWLQLESSCQNLLMKVLSHCIQSKWTLLLLYWLPR